MLSTFTVTPGLPAAIGALSLNLLDHGRVRLAWDEPDNGGASIDGYDVSTSPNIPIEVETSSAVLGPLSGVTQVTIRARNQVGVGATRTVTVTVAIDGSAISLR